MEEARKGIPQQLDSRITRLGALLDNLPPSLPVLPPEEAYGFGLDTGDIEDEGVLYAFNRNLEVVFSTYQCPEIKLSQRGPCFKELVTMFRRVAKEITPTERDNPDGHLRRWLKRLINAAERAGAKIVKKKPKSQLIESSSEEEEPQALLRLRRSRNPGHRKVIDIVSSDDQKDTDQEPIVVLSSDSESNSSQAVAVPSKPSTAPASAPKPVPAKRARVERSDSSDGEVKPALRQRTLFDMGCKKVSKEEAQEQSKRITKMLGVDRERLKEEEEARREIKEERRKEQDRIRQQRHRAKKRSAGGSQGRKAKAVVLGVDAGAGLVSSLLQDNLPSLSRPDAGWKKGRNGKKGGVVKDGKHERTNWFNPFLWSAIARIAPRVCWSPTLIVKHLQNEQPVLYRRLRKNVVARWISKSKNRWSKKTKAKVEAGSSLKGTGRVGVLTPYPEIVAEVKEKLSGLRTAGITVDRVLGRSIFISVIKERQPQILDNFKCGEEYVGQFYESVMGWSLRCGTRPAAKLPADAIEQTERTLFRLVHLINLYEIPPEMIVNMDQTGVILLMSKKRTFAETNSRQVDISAHDEKRAYTLCVASTPAGNILPFQQVWAGKSAGSLPTAAAPGYTEAMEEGFHFASADSPKKTSHFSTMKTMIEWIEEILEPYLRDFVETNKARLGLQDDQKAILLLDCYPVHISEDFRLHVFSKYPNIFLLFIPAGCTGIFQPADVGLNRVIKHFLRQQALEFFVQSHTEQLSNGLTPEQVKFTTSLPVLRNACVRPIVRLYQYLQSYSGRMLIKRAWEKCTVKEWNLGAECLTSRQAKIAYASYLEGDEILRHEIEAKIGRDALLNAAAHAIAEEVIDDEDIYDPQDSSEIPLATIVAEVTGEHTVDAAELESRTGLCVESTSVEREDDGRLVVTSAEESIWSYTTDGQTWSNTLGSS